MLLGDRQVFATTLVEMEHGEQIEHDIDESLKQCDIYVLLIGNRYSEYTEREFNYAWTAGIPIKAYLIRSTDRANRTETRKQQSFLASLKSKVRIEGMNDPYRSQGRFLLRLLSNIENDVAGIVLRGIHQYVGIRRIIR